VITCPRVDARIKPYSSTHNTRIERVWLEVGLQFAHRWKALFERLEASYGLDPQKPDHLWLLSVLFLDNINDDVQLFTHTFNNHNVKNAAQGSQSPKASFCVYTYDG
jgi:hypothetical protein